MRPALDESFKGLLRALEVALASVDSDADEARAALRRIGESVAGAAKAASQQHVAETARLLAAAHKTSTASKRAQALVAALREGLDKSRVAQRILLVDDDRLLAAVMSENLGGPDLHLTVARTMAEARTLLADEEFAAVLLDLVLPDGDGRRLLMGIREEERLRALPVVVITSKQGPQAMTECLALGADAFLEKPLDMPRVSALLHNLLKRGAPGRSVPALSAAPRRLLLVEEDELLAQMLRHRLERAGWHVDSCRDGMSALKLIDQHSFGVAIMDVRSPGADGYALLRALRERKDVRTRTVLLSDPGGENQVTDGFRAGADDVLVKPISPSELIARVNHLVEPVTDE